MANVDLKERMGSAYLQGRKARQEGANIESCPFHEETVLRESWEKGWYEKDAAISEGLEGFVPKKLPAVRRTSAGLRDAIFDELDALRAGSTDSKRAAAVAKMASSIIETVRLEIDVAKWAGQKAGAAQAIAPKAISFDVKEGDKE